LYSPPARLLTLTVTKLPGRSGFLENFKRSARDQNVNLMTTETGGKGYGNVEPLDFITRHGVSYFPMYHENQDRRGVLLGVHRNSEGVLFVTSRAMTSAGQPKDITNAAAVSKAGVASKVTDAITRPEVTCSSLSSHCCYNVIQKRRAFTMLLRSRQTPRDKQGIFHYNEP
jgi:hypothetical protein